MIKSLLLTSTRSHELIAMFHVSVDIMISVLTNLFHCVHLVNIKLSRALKQLRIITEKTVGTLGEVIYGMTVYDWVHELQKARNEQERLFTLIVYGDLLGIPILPPYYTLRLLPFLVPSLENWRRSMLRERDLTDLINQEIG
jgi:hypothetical protein